MKNGTKWCVCQRSLGHVARLSLWSCPSKHLPSPARCCYSSLIFIFPTFYCTKLVTSLTQLLLAEFIASQILFELDPLETGLVKCWLRRHWERRFRPTSCPLIISVSQIRKAVAAVCANVSHWNERYSSVLQFKDPLVSLLICIWGFPFASARGICHRAWEDLKQHSPSLQTILNCLTVYYSERKVKQLLLLWVLERGQLWAHR